MRDVTIRARGHRNVRATHAKTIEVTTDADLTRRGTCIVAVAATLDPARLVGLEGPVVVTFDASGVHDVVRGVANPRYDASSGRLVIRRSHRTSPDTLVVDADRGSADLDRALVEALGDDRGEVTITITRDEDVTEAAPAVLDVDLAGLGASAAHIAVTLTGTTTAVSLAGRLPRRTGDRRRALAGAPRGLTVWEVRPQDVVAAAADLGARLVAVVVDPTTPDERVHLAAPPDPPARARTAFVVARDVDAGATEGGDRLLAALLDAGISMKTLQDALVTATGGTKRDAYDRILRSRAT